MEDNKAPSNVIQFPTMKRKETETSGQKPAAPNPSSPEPKAKKKRSAKKNVAGTVLAIILATGAVNRFAFGNSPKSADLASNSGGRNIASTVTSGSYERNADWEKNLAEQLASPQARNIASVQVGRAATSEEKLRWGTLEEKYTITYKQDAHEIDSILLQGEGQSNPSYILSRDKFIRDYGSLLEKDYASSKLKSVQTVNDKTIESFTLFNKDKQAKSEVRFELDRHQRLLSLKVESI